MSVLDRGWVWVLYSDKSLVCVVQNNSSFLHVSETICMVKKGKGEGAEMGDGEDEEMEEVKQGPLAGRGPTVQDRWMLTHEITPLATELLQNRGVSGRFLISYSIVETEAQMSYILFQQHIHNQRVGRLSM